MDEEFIQLAQSHVSAIKAGEISVDSLAISLGAGAPEVPGEGWNVIAGSLGEAAIAPNAGGVEKARKTGRHLLREVIPFLRKIICDDLDFCNTEETVGDWVRKVAGQFPGAAPPAWLATILATLGLAGLAWQAVLAVAIAVVVVFGLRRFCRCSLGPLAVAPDELDAALA